MRGAFGQVHELAQTRYPGLDVIGSNYPVPAWKQPIISAVRYVQFSLLGVCLFGERVFLFLGMPAPPEWYVRNVATNRFGAAMGVFFVGNLITTNMMSTGAFEIYFDGQLVFSKLAEGRMPTALDILAPLEAFYGPPGPVAGRRLGRAAEAAGAALGAAPSGGM